MHHIAAIALPPMGVLVASGLDPEAVEKLAEFTERHPGFCVCVFFLWMIRSGLQWYVMREHKAGASAKAMLEIFNQAGVLPQFVNKGAEATAQQVSEQNNLDTQAGTK